MKCIARGKEILEHFSNLRFLRSSKIVFFSLERNEQDLRPPKNVVLRVFLTFLSLYVQPYSKLIFFFQNLPLFNTLKRKIILNQSAIFVNKSVMSKDALCNECFLLCFYYQHPVMRFFSYVIHCYAAYRNWTQSWKNCITGCW